MKKTLMKFIKNTAVISTLIFCQLANAEHIIVDMANNYPYKNLISRTDAVKVFYITNDGNRHCRVEVVLDKMKWTSADKEISKEAFNHEVLSNCLSREAAEQILFQTFLQFGRGL